MITIEPTAAAAFLDGGLPGLLTLAGGSVRVALFYRGTECTGNGYSRKTCSTVDAAVEDDSHTYGDIGDVTFTATGSAIVFDQIRVYAADGTTLLSKTPPSPSSITPGEPQVMTLRYQLPTNALHPNDVELLGAVPLLPGSGYSDSDMTANVTTFNGLFATGWRDTRDQIRMAGRRFAINDQLVMENMAGLGFDTTGLGGMYAESQYGGAIDSELSDNGGPATGIVWGDPDNLGGSAITYRNRGCDWGRMNFSGVLELDDPNDITTAPRKSVCMEVQGRDVLGRMPSGKMLGDLRFQAFDTCIHTIATPFEDNADQFKLGRCEVAYCGTFFHSENKQTLGNEFAYVDAFHVDTVFKFYRGGKTKIGTLCMQTGVNTGLQVRAEPAHIFSYIKFEELILDGTSDPDALAIDVESNNPSSNWTAPRVRIFDLNVDENVANRTDNPCLRMVNNFGTLEVFGGDGFYQRMVHVSGGVANFFPKVFIYGGRFRSGQDLTTIRTLFTVASRGYVSVVWRDNYEANGAGANAGKNWPTYQNLINITGNGDGDFSVI